MSDDVCRVCVRGRAEREQPIGCTSEPMPPQCCGAATTVTNKRRRRRRRGSRCFHSQSNIRRLLPDVIFISIISLMNSQSAVVECQPPSRLPKSGDSRTLAKVLWGQRGLVFLGRLGPCTPPAVAVCLWAGRAVIPFHSPSSRVCSMLFTSQCDQADDRELAWRDLVRRGLRRRPCCHSARNCMLVRRLLAMQRCCTCRDRQRLGRP